MPARYLLITLSIIMLSLSPNASANDSNIKVLFSPQDECGKEILNAINKAEYSINVAMYQLTSSELTHALREACRRGVNVRVYLDGDNADEYYSKESFLKRSGVKTLKETGEGLMHNKFCVIDDKTVITGSYNWTTSADLINDENILIIQSKEIATIFNAQFEKYWLGDYQDKGYYKDKRHLIKF